MPRSGRMMRWKVVICVCVYVVVMLVQNSSSFRLPARIGAQMLPTVRLHYSRLSATTSAPPETPKTELGGDRSGDVESPGVRKMRLGVLFLNLGGPETQDDVEGFLYNLFADPDIIRLPGLLSVFQAPLAWFIAKRRAPKSSAAYESIGGGSPIVKYTREQSTLIEAELRSRMSRIPGLSSSDAVAPRCYFAMRYWHPFTDDVLEQMYTDGINTMVIVPLYPQFSISTSGSSLRVLQDLFYEQPERWSATGANQFLHTVVPAWYYRKGYVDSMAKLVLKELGTFTPEQFASRQGVHVLFSAHGVPQSYIEAGDPYQAQMEECVTLICRRTDELLQAGECEGLSTDDCKLLASGGPSLSGEAPGDDGNDNRQGGLQFHLSFQSRVGPVQWLKPYTEERLVELGQEGVENLVVVPVSFVSEHIETLEEIDMEYRELAEENGVKEWRRVPALNTDQGFIKDMADLVEEALRSPVVSVAEAAAQNSNDLSFSSSVRLAAVDASQDSIRLPLSGGDDKAIGKGGDGNGRAELNGGRIAMLAFLATLVAEASSGHPILQVLGIKP